jgi:hypothetical protein
MDVECYRAPQIIVAGERNALIGTPRREILLRLVQILTEQPVSFHGALLHRPEWDHLVHPHTMNRRIS